MVTDIPISISCASDEAYYCGLLVTLHSLVSSACEGSSIVCHVLDTGLSENSRTDLTCRISSIPGRSAKVVFHSIDISSFEDLPTWRGSHTAYVRLLLQDVLKDEDYTVYTDVDTLWLRDVSELWAMRGQVPVLAATPDGSGLREFSSGSERARKFSEHGKNIDPDGYYCTGLMLMNLKELRNRNFTAMWREFVHSHYDIMKFADQDIYNWFFQSSDILYLDFRWGEFAAAYGLRGLISPRVIHYANATPWKKGVSAINALWWGYIRKNIRGLKISRMAYIKSLKFSLLKGPIVFNIIYGVSFLLNRKAYFKRKSAIFLPERGFEHPKHVNDSKCGEQFNAPMVSVVLPVYNAEPYLTEALESIRGQTLSAWECICVDDGSTDASSDILDRFAAIDPRFKVVHQSNSGCHAARNKAPEITSSPRNLFMDADDVYHANAFETLFRIAEEYDVDAVESRYCRLKEKLSCAGDVTLVKDPVARMVHDTKSRGEPWGRILRTSKFKHIQFVPGYHDDVKWVTSATMKMSNLAVVCAPMYFWRPVATSISNKPDYYCALPELWRYQAKECPMIKHRLGVIAYSYFKIMPTIVSSYMMRNLRKDGVISFRWLSLRKRLKLYLSGMVMNRGHQ